MPADLPHPDSPLLLLADLQQQEMQWQNQLLALGNSCQQALSQRQSKLEQLKGERANLRIKQEKARAREALAKARVKSQPSETARGQLQRAKQNLETLKDTLRSMRGQIQQLEVELGQYREAQRFYKQRSKALQAHAQQWRQRHATEPRRGRPPKTARTEKGASSGKRKPRPQGNAITVNKRRGRLPLNPQVPPSIFDPLP